jgi:U3 small nucleolar RNA-associated protein 14
MEKEINEVLEKSGLTEKKIREMEELELNKISKEEVLISN